MLKFIHTLTVLFLLLFLRGVGGGNLSAVQTLRWVYFSRQFLAFKHLELTDSSVAKTDTVCRCLTKWVACCFFVYFNLELISTLKCHCLCFTTAKELVPINKWIQHSRDKINFFFFLFFFFMLRHVVCKITTQLWYNRRDFRMRCGPLSVDMRNHPVNETRRNQTEPYGARLPVLFRSSSGGEPRTWQILQPCSSAPTPTTPTTPRMADLQYYCRFAASLTRAFLHLVEVWQTLSLFWDLTPRNMVNTYRQFGATSSDIYGLQG